MNSETSKNGLALLQCNYGSEDECSPEDIECDEPSTTLAESGPGSSCDTDIGSQIPLSTQPILGLLPRAPELGHETRPHQPESIQTDVLGEASLIPPNENTDKIVTSDSGTSPSVAGSSQPANPTTILLTGGQPVHRDVEHLEFPKTYREVAPSSESDSESSSDESCLSTPALADIDDDAEDELGGGRQPGQPQPKSKMLEDLGIFDLAPLEDLKITVPEEECIPIGKVHNIIDMLVIVMANKGCPALDLDSVLFLDHGKRMLGQVFDVFGPVSEPLYMVRFNSEQHILDEGIHKGMDVYFAPRTKHTAFVFIEALFQQRGSDASWENDQEPPENCLDYSDDEKERQAKMAHRLKKKALDPTAASPSPTPTRRKRNPRPQRQRGAPPSHHPPANPFYMLPPPVYSPYHQQPPMIAPPNSWPTPYQNPPAAASNYASPYCYPPSGAPSNQPPPPTPPRPPPQQ